MLVIETPTDRESIESGDEKESMERIKEIDSLLNTQRQHMDSVYMIKVGVSIPS